MNLLTDSGFKKDNNKKVVYLDQNFISAIAKVQLGQIKDERFTAIYETLTALSEDGKIVIPESTFHTIESAWASEIIKAEALEILKSLSREVGVKDWRDILDLQMGRAVEGFFSGVTIQPSRQEAFHKTPKEFLTDTFFDLSVTSRIKNLFALHTGRREALSEKPSGKSRKQLPQETLKFFKIEKEDERRALVCDYFERPCRKEHLSNCIVDAYRVNRGHSQIVAGYREFDPDFRRFNEFCNSSELEGVPFIDIVSSLTAAVTAYEGARSPQTGDFYDILIVGTILPYCDALATDNFMKSLLVSRLGFDKKYDVEVFSKKDNETDRFLEYLHCLSSQES
ncbi:MAG TPA: hypothetical protein ACFYD2_08805 [Candidatus Avalokitesvara rifleensis]|uniref:hypothetical protein n=1 Tax=Candidatus Avalokitesvara rifleensis TaxID=3367620 RepID=UPI00271271B2|nr:hypothetical protein [Candidatus Brocadiales bacterium]